MARPQSPQLLNTLPLPLLLAPLILLSLLTGYTLFLSPSEALIPVFAQCPVPPHSSTTQSPNLLTNILKDPLPYLPTPLCYLSNFFTTALSPLNPSSKPAMSLILSAIAALLTTCTLESARLANTHKDSLRSTKWIIRYLTPIWLVFNLAAGALAWQLVIVPGILVQRRSGVRVRQQQQGKERNHEGKGKQSIAREHPDLGVLRRHLNSHAEVFAIPLGVLLGYIIPSLWMLDDPSPTPVVLWLFFPLWVSLVRIFVRWLLVSVAPVAMRRRHYLEKSTFSLVLLYGVPVLWSVVAQGMVVRYIWTSALGTPSMESGQVVEDTQIQLDAAREALGFIVTDFAAIGLTVGYWLWLEAGAGVLGIATLVGLILGPGTGWITGWIMREDQDEGKFAVIEGDAEREKSD